MKVIQIKDKGDVRIPADMRHELGLMDGDRLLIELDGDHLVMRPIRATKRPEGHLGVFRHVVAQGGPPVGCDTIEQSVVDDVVGGAHRHE